MAWNSNFAVFYDYDPTQEITCRMERPPLPRGLSDEMVKVGQERKRRLTVDQIERLERSFEEEKKLEPERKLRLAEELGLQPRQVAVWFQNRRARWKAKQLEHVYGALKLEFDAVSREKQKLQEEVIKLKAELHEVAAIAATKQSSTTGTDATSAEETVDSALVAHNTYNNNMSSNNNNQKLQNCQQMGECNYVMNVDDYNSGLHSYWGVLPNYP